MLAQEILHSMEESSLNNDLLVIKLDMQRAYDRMTWKFLCKVPRKFRFNRKWVGWIVARISSLAFPVLVNGESTD